MQQYTLTVYASVCELQQLEMQVEAFTLATTLAPHERGQWRLELILEDQPTPEQKALFIGLKTEVQPLTQQDWLAAGAHAGSAAPIGGFTLTDRAAPLLSGRWLGLAGVHAFGDGHHTTTRGCIAALAQIRQRGAAIRRIADIGCGTGVLAAAALKLWPQARAWASDMDAAAVTATQTCIRLNGLGGRLHVFEAAGFARHTGNYDLILMNILAGPLRRLAAQAVRQLRPGGWLVLSGLLEEQCAMVISAYRDCHLAVVAQSRQDGWMTLTLRKHS